MDYYYVYIIIIIIIITSFYYVLSVLMKFMFTLSVPETYEEVRLRIFF